MDLYKDLDKLHRDLSNIISKLNSREFNASTIKRLTDSYSYVSKIEEKEDINHIENKIINEAKKGEYGCTIYKDNLSCNVINYFKDNGFTIDRMHYNSNNVYDIYLGR